MRTETIVKTYATFKELTPEQQAKVIENNRPINVDYEGWSERVTDNFTVALGLIGFDVAHMFFTGFWSQGDGASFTGTYRYVKGGIENLKKEFPNWTEFHSIAERLQQLQKVNFYSIECSIYRSGFYYHSNTMYTDGFECKNYTVETENEVLEIFRDVADLYYSALSKEYEYLTSDDAVSESIISNEIEFDIETLE